MNIGQLLDIAQHRFPEKTALISHDRLCTYTLLRERVRRLMNGFLKMAVCKGDRVAAMMMNRSELIEVYLASVSVGAMFMPINFRLQEAELKFILEEAQPRVLLCEQRYSNLLEKIAAELSFAPPHCFTISDLPGPREAGSYEELLASNTPQVQAQSLDSQDPCQLMYTSGTTGRPKGVMLSHQNVIWNSLNMLQVRRDRPEDVALIVGPLFHTAALNSHYTSRLALGATTVIMSSFDPLGMMELVERQRVTVVSGTPTMFVILTEKCRPGQFDTSSVSTLTSGSDKLPDHVKRTVLEYFPNAKGIFDVYGSTECSPCVTTLTAEESLRKTGCVGRPLAFLQVKLLDETGREVPRGERGEVAVRGPNVMLGYYNQPEETAKVLKNGWLHTGDLAVADEDGALYIIDRMKDLIITGGENVSPREVEEVLFSHPCVLKTAVVGVPDHKWGEKICAAVVLREGCQANEKELQQYCKSRVAGFKVPKKFLFLDRLPESATGKVQKSKLLNLLTE